MLVGAVLISSFSSPPRANQGQVTESERPSPASLRPESRRAGRRDRAAGRSRRPVTPDRARSPAAAPPGPRRIPGGDGPIVGSGRGPGDDY
eukprot:47458-Hanusia_phi.AAC.1